MKIAYSLATIIATLTTVNITALAQPSEGTWDGTTLTKPRPWEPINIPSQFGAGSISNGALGGGGVGIPIPPYMPPIDDRSSFTGNGECSEIGGVAIAGNPVVIATANKSERLPVFTTPGEKPIALNLAWNSKFELRGHFGYNWLTLFDKRLHFVYENGEHCNVNPGGGSCGRNASARHVQTYALRPDGSKVRLWLWGAQRNPNSMYQLGGNFETGFTLKIDGEDVEHYSGSGVIQKEVNRNGITWKYNYSTTHANRLLSVTHSSGRSIGFNYTGTNPVVSSFTDTAGTIYTWGTTATLDTLTYPDGDTVSFHYSSGRAKLLLGKSLNGIRHSTFIYDRNDLPISTEHSGGVEKTTFSYTLGSNGKASKVVVTNPLGRSTIYHINDRSLVTGVDGAATMRCAADISEMSYSINDKPDISVSNAGIVTDYDYNYYGQLLKVVEAIGTAQARTTINTWEPAPLNRLLSSERPGQWRRTYTYTPSGRPSSYEDRNLSTNGSQNQALLTKYAYTFHENGMVASWVVKGPKGSADTLTTNYNSRGEVTSVVDGLGHRVTYSKFNGLGLPGRIVGQNGQTMELIYDLRGRVTKSRVYPNGETPVDTLYQYTTGLVSKVDTSDGTTTHSIYDTARRLVGIYEINGSGRHPYRIYTYNLNSDVIQERAGESLSVPTAGTTEGMSHRFFKDYDEAGRVFQIRGNDNQFLRLKYGANGKLAESTDASGSVTYDYDALGRLEKKVFPGNATEEFGYDVNDNPIRIKDVNGFVTKRVFDGLGRLWREASPDAGVKIWEYGGNGLLTRMTRANSVITTYGYDSSGRQISISAGGESQSFQYDRCAGGKGRLCRVVDSNGELTYTYTPQGLLLTQGQKIGNSTHNFGQVYAYDTHGRLTGISYPGGISVGYGFIKGKPRSMTVKIEGATYNVATGIGSNPLGAISNWTYGNGLLRNSTFDSDGRLTTLSTRSGSAYIQNMSYKFTSGNKIGQITNHLNKAHTQSFGYDPLSRLTALTASGANQSFGWDANGNRTSHSWGGQTDLYATASTSNRLTRITGPRAISYSYDANGNTLSGDGVAYSYSHFNRLKSATRGGVTTNYWINPLGQRTRKDQGSTATTIGYVYGRSGQLEVEYNLGSKQWTHYLRLPTGEPVAMVRSKQLYMIHTDHLSRPEVVTNNAKRVVWRARNYAFDRTVAQDEVGGLHLSFPGQYHDMETGMAYNNFRTYNPRTGRYLESDPIGLGGGMNSYAYAGGNPISNVDFFGLKDCLCSSASFGQTREQLPSKGALRQVHDGVTSYGSGAAWGGTALAARSGLLGSGAKLDAINTNAQLGNALGQMASHPGQTATVVGAIASKYPVQMLSRLGSGVAVSYGFSPYVGIPLSGLAIYGSAFKTAYQHPYAIAAATIVGEELCP